MKTTGQRAVGTTRQDNEKNHVFLMFCKDDAKTQIYAEIAITIRKQMIQKMQKNEDNGRARCGDDASRQ